MNVTLTFNVFFGPLALVMLVGCGSMKNYEFDQIDEKIELEHNRLVSLQSTLAENHKEQVRLGEFLDYANSPSGKRFHQNAQCNTPVSPVRTSTSMPTHACETQVQREQLMTQKCDVINNCDVVSGAVALNKLPISASYLLTTGCAASHADEPLLENPQPIVEATTATLCTVGLGKLPKWLRIPGLGKLAVTGALMAVRGFACANSVDRFKNRIDDQHSCMVKAASDCDKAFRLWQSNKNKHIQVAERKTTESQAELRRCESITNRFPGLDRFAAQDKFTMMEKHAIEITARIDKAHKAVLDAQAAKISVSTKYRGYQSYTPPDPG